MTQNNLNSAPFKGVLFDMDGLLLDTERISLLAFDQSVAGFGLPNMRHVVLACVGLRSDTRRGIIETALAGRVAYDDFNADYRARKAGLLAVEMPLRPGAASLLKTLNDLKIPCALATSTRTKSAEAHMERAELAQYFHSIIGGDQVENGKPAPDIYHKAAAAIGQGAAHCAAFEDSNPGTRAAIASGATTVQVPDIKPPDPDLLANGHVIARDLLSGARQIGLIG